MAKTINKDIDIFNTLEKAEKAFNKCNSADLLSAKSFKGTIDYYVDISKTALASWPNLYTLIKSK